MYVEFYEHRRRVASTLLDLARRKTGSDAATARALGVPRQQVSDWRNARQNFPDKYIAKTCQIAGEVIGVWLSMYLNSKTNNLGDASGPGSMPSALSQHSDQV